MFSQKTFLRLAGTIFGIVGTLHFLRLFTNWQVILAGVVIPQWVSVLGFLVGWYLSYNAFKLLSGKKWEVRI